MFFIDLTVSSPERFDLSKFLDKTGNLSVTNGSEPSPDPLTSYFLTTLPALPPRIQYPVLMEEGRPDLVSFRVYGDVQYWWVVLLYNNLFRAEDLVRGLMLNLPSKDDLSTLYFRLNALNQ